MSIQSPQLPTLITKSALSQAVLRYIPKELHKYVKLPLGDFEEAKNDGKEELEWMISNSDNMLRMYGSGEELAEYLKIYIGFSSDRWMGYDLIEPYHAFVTEFCSLRGDTFIPKSHMYRFLHHSLYLKADTVKYSKIYNAILSIYLKSEAARNAENLEFVKLADFKKIVDKLNRELDESQILMKQQQYITLVRNRCTLRPKIHSKSHRRSHSENNKWCMRL
ncbi:hypothetical protein B9Z55_009055 [Caenorhabditis nigoni]|uniref:DUF7809 domain-containing protein n=1 Tax=Caenorhabditis nigoni TaxID=1611254 RepID=A0A2G5UQD5_9PELO|nr:hypothetical protein B9Z55_009055 [Caenorhabditis nigoni]